MCRLSFVMFLGALMLSTNFQRAESFSHHRIDGQSKDSHEHQDSVDSKELPQETTITPIDTTSDEQVDSEENKIVKRDVVLQPSSGHSSEEQDTTTVIPLENQSDEDNVDSKEIQLVKRDVQVNTTTDGHSSEEDVTTISLTDLSVEDDVVDSGERLKVKRNVQVETVIIDHSSEEEKANASTVSQVNQSDEYDYDYSEELFKREIQQLTAEELEILFQLFNSEENTREEEIFIGNHSDEYDHFDSVEKRNARQLTSDGHSSEEHTTGSAFDHSFENSIEDVLEQLAFDAKLPSTALRI